MDDIGFYLVIAYLFLVPWLVAFLPPRESLRWIAFAIGAALLAFYALDTIHVWVDAPAAAPPEVRHPRRDPLPPRARPLPEGPRVQALNPAAF